MNAKDNLIGYMTAELGYTEGDLMAVPHRELVNMLTAAQIQELLDYNTQV